MIEMAKHTKYISLQKQRKGWIQDLYNNLGSDASKIMGRFRAITDVLALSATQVSKFKKKEGITIEGQINELTTKLENVFSQVTATSMLKLNQVIENNTNQAQAIGTIRSIMNTYQIYGAERVLNLYEQIVSAHEEGEDFYERFMSKIADAALTGKNVVRSAGQLLKSHERVDLF